MSIAAILATMQGIFKFWDQITWLIKKLESTPEEKRQKIVISIDGEQTSFEQTGRPKW